MATKKKVRKRGLTSTSRAFIVRELAFYATPTEVAEMVSDKFHVEVTPQNVQKYDPTKVAGKDCAKCWREMFYDLRKKFLKHIDKYVPEANKAVRVHNLARQARKHIKSGNYPAMADAYERIAKELGNVHTNKREFTGKGGGPIKYQDIDMMTEDQVDDELRKYGFDPSVHPAPAAKQ